MSNPAIPFGFLDKGLMDGYAPTFGVYPAQISTGNTNKIYAGDVAAPISGGYYDVATVVGGGGPIGGIFAGNFAYNSLSAGMLNRNRAWLGQTGDLAAGSLITCDVLVASETVYKVRTAGTSGLPVGQTSVGKFANFAIGSAPGNNLISAFWLDDNTINAAQGSLPFVIVGIAQQPESDPTSINNIVYVRVVNLAQPN